MVSQVLAWLGLVTVALVSVHWALGAALRRGRLTLVPLRRFYRWLDELPTMLDAQHRAERRRQARVLRAQHTREAIARASAPMPLDTDPEVEWEGNVAHPRFGAGKRPGHPHNLH